MRVCDVEVVAGRYHVLRGPVVDDDLTPPNALPEEVVYVDLDGSALTYLLDVTTSKTLSGGIVVKQVEIRPGVIVDFVEIELAPADTVGLGGRRVEHELGMVDALGNPSVLMQGQVHVRATRLP